MLIIDLEELVKNKNLFADNKMISNNLKKEFRLRTANLRALPNFIIAGAQKAGTTSLFYYLGQHPQIVRSYTKEVLYFDGGTNPQIDNYKKGLNWYKSHFPLRLELGKNCMTGEASPLYLFYPEAPQRMKQVLPDVKIIILLRNPVDRAISHYFHQVRKGREKLPIMEALKAEEARLSKALESKNYRDFNFINYSYKARGHYKDQVEKYFNLFERDNIFLVDSKDLFKDTSSLLTNIFRFLKVDQSFVVENLEPRNTLSRDKYLSKSREELGSCVYDYLNEYFHSKNLDLYQFLGNSYDW